MIDGLAERFDKVDGVSGNPKANIQSSVMQI